MARRTYKRKTRRRLRGGNANGFKNARTVRVGIQQKENNIYTPENGVPTLRRAKMRVTNSA